MEHNFKDFDKYLRDNISDMELFKKEGNWDLMNGLIEKQEKKNKNRKLILLSFLIIGLISLGSFYLLNKDSVKYVNYNKKSSEITTVITENFSPNNNAKSTHKTPNNLNKTEGKALNNSTVKQLQKNTKNSYTLQSIEAKPEYIKKKNTAGNSINGAFNNAGSSNPFKQESLKNNVVFSASNNEIETNKETSFKVNAPQIDSSVFSDYRSAILTKNIEVRDSNTLSIKIPDTNKTLLISQTDTIIKPKNITPQKNLGLNIYAGINIYSTSYSFKEQWNLSPIIGAELRYNLNRFFDFGIAVLYTEESGYHLTDTVIRESYFLDKYTAEQSIQINQLIKLYIPVTIYYKLTQNQSILLALQLNYLLNSIGNYREINETSSSYSEFQKDNIKGFVDGIKPYNMAISFGYKLRLSNRFDISIRANKDLATPFIKDYFHGIQNQASWSFQTCIIAKF